MQELYLDPQVFIRSMATRGAMGGLARATLDAVDLMDAAGYDRILVETVGVGQDEVEVVRAVDTVVVVALPGMGDEIQAIKAGIMEIADVFVVNKSDRQGAERTRKDLAMLLGLTDDPDAEPAWRPPIVKTVASRGEGVDELAAAIEEHRAFLESSGGLDERRLSRLRLRVETILQQRVLARAAEISEMRDELARALEDRTDPYTVAERLFGRVVGSG